MFKVNYPLLRQVLQSIRNNPESHKQATWVGVMGELPKGFMVSHEKVGERELLTATGSCHTTACIAGWTLLHSKFEAKDPFRGGNWYGGHSVVYNSLLSPEGAHYASDRIGEEAAALLGIYGLHYDQVFMDMDDKRAIAQMMFLHEKGRLPEIVGFDMDEDGYGSMEQYTPEDTDAAGLMEFDALELDGQPSDEFVKEWYGRFLEAFKPEKAPQPQSGWETKDLDD